MTAPAATTAVPAVPVPAEAIPLSRWQTIRACLSDVIGETAAGLRPSQRTTGRSLAEYARRWGSQRDAARWRSAATLDEAIALSSFGDRTLTALLDHRPWRIPAPVFFRWRAHQIAAIMTARFPLDTPITEVGCGLGKNLLLLAWAGYHDLAGLDPVPEAVQAVRDQAEWFGLPVATGSVNLLGLGPDSGLAGRVVLTNHVLEQLPRRTGAAVDALIAARPVEVVHLEPCRELLRLHRLVDASTAWHIRSADYQRDLLDQLRARERAGSVRIHEVARLGYAPRLRHDPVLIRWSPS